MYNLHERISALCEEVNVSPSRMCLDLRLAKSLMTELKSGRSKQLSFSTASKIANYFSVPVSYFTELSPFDHWEFINQDRADFLRYVDIPADILNAVWGIDLSNPNAAKLVNFIRFVSEAFDTVIFTEDRTWSVEVKDAFKTKKEAPAPTGGDEREVTDADIKFALFGDAEIDDDVLDEVKRFAKFAMDQKEQRKQSD